MAHGGFRGAPAFSIPSGPATSIGAEGEMARVSIASLLEGAGSPVTVEPVGGGGSYVTVGQHGMIADLYSSGSQSLLTLDFGSVVPAPPTTVDDLFRHDLLDSASGGNVHVPLAELLNGNDVSGGALLGVAGEQHVPDTLHVLAAEQAVPGVFEGPLWLATPDHLSSMARLELGHDQMATFVGSDAAMPISEHHVIA